MGADYTQRYSDLQEELEKAKFTLLALNNNIRRIAGQTPSTSKEIRIKGKQAAELKRKDFVRQGTKSYSEVAESKKRCHDSKSSVFNRLSPAPPAVRSNNEEIRPKLTSHVVREMPSRQEVVAAQTADSESHARNRRMFGSLLGTLHKFCQEESRLQQKEEKKALIEKKLEKQEMLERELLKKEREALFLNRKRKQIQIKQLELKMSRLRDFEMWEASMQHLNAFIKTKTTPAIYYRPKEMSRKTEKLLAQHQQQIAKAIDKRRRQVSEELKLFEMTDDAIGIDHHHDNNEDGNNDCNKKLNHSTDDNSIDNRRNKSSPKLQSIITQQQSQEPQEPQQPQPSPPQQQQQQQHPDEASNNKTATSSHNAEEVSLSSSVVIVKHLQ